MEKELIHAGVWECYFCHTKSIHIGTDRGSSNTQCPNGCAGRFNLIMRYPLATDLDGIKDAFGDTPARCKGGDDR